MISMPIERAAPSTVRTADSSRVVFKSGSFVWAISLTWARVTCPTLVRLGSHDPLMIPAAFFRRTAAGGVLVTKENERSA